MKVGCCFSFLCCVWRMVEARHGTGLPEPSESSALLEAGGEGVRGPLLMLIWEQPRRGLTTLPHFGRHTSCMIKCCQTRKAN